MVKIFKHIDSVLRKKISGATFKGYLLIRTELGDFITPERKLEKVLNLEFVKSDEILSSLIKDVIFEQNKYYSFKKVLFLSLKSIDELANMLLPKNYFLSVSPFDEIINSEDKYEYFYLPKRTGGFRQITKPKTPGLLLIQRNLNFLLNLVYNQHPNSHGFTWNKNILTNASVHTGRKYVLNIDIKDFFPSIANYHIKNLFSSKPFCFSEEIVSSLVKICCNNNQLPQGAPTSPVLTNIICFPLDIELKKLSESLNINYTRYADDITFSSDSAIFDVKFKDIIESHLISKGFTINNKKYRLQNRTKRQEVTGLTVNEKPNINRKYIRNLRAILYSLENDDPSDFKKKFYISYGKYRLTGMPYILECIKGRINFVGQIRGRDDLIYLKLKTKYKNLIIKINAMRK